MFDALIKIGGSLWKLPDLRSIAARWSDLATQHRLLALPGGGPFADRVRAVDRRIGLGNAAAHWMAVLAMDQYAYLLADLAPDAALVRDLDAAASASGEGRLPILAPSRLLQCADPLPHSWHVTSDSIAAWLAGAARINRLVLLKRGVEVEFDNALDAEPIVQREISAQALASSGIVDPYFAQALQPDTDCWIINGREAERLAQLLRDGITQGMRVINRD